MSENVEFELFDSRALFRLLGGLICYVEINVKNI